MAHSASWKPFEESCCDREGRRRPRVLLADDYQPLLRLLAKALDGDFDVVGAVSDGKSLVEAALALRPDAIVTDWAMPEMTGLEAALEIRRSVPNTRIIFCSSHDDPAYAAAALACGATAYIVKGALPDVTSAVRAALKDGAAAA